MTTIEGNVQRVTFPQLSGRTLTLNTPALSAGLPATQYKVVGYDTATALVRVIADNGKVSTIALADIQNAILTGVLFVQGEK